MSEKTKKGRTLINALGIPGLLFIIWLGGIYFTILMSVVIVLALNEFYGIYKQKGINASMPLGLVAAAFFIWYYHTDPYINMFTFLQVAIVFTLLSLLIELFSKKDNFASNLSYTFFGIVYIPMLLGSLIAIRQMDVTYSTHFTFAIFLSVWLCDSAAYGFGVKWGKKKILPKVSPNKSWVGSIAGYFSALIFFIILSYYNFPSSNFSIKDILIFSIISGIFGQLGDFTESMFKRDVGVKDSSTFLLGHGGVLDRFDSLIFVAPLSYFYLLF
ncbi:MAG: phosphatidate cytidylyltransferase [Fidelibacterota bacterium]